MDFTLLDQKLRETFADYRLTNPERDELRDLGITLDFERIRFMRNRAFDMVREVINQEENSQEKTLLALKWLEQVIKTFDMCLEPQNIYVSAHFTPSDHCKNKIIELSREAKHSIDVCVFTISDNDLSEALICAHNRGIPVRIVTDNDKQYDIGSDIHQLRQAGVPLCTDKTEYHMHHKFAIFDRKILLNGSFNWTVSASRNNFENILTTDNPSLMSQYIDQFEQLWFSYQ